MTTTLAELHARAGIGYTGGGTQLPIAQVIPQAAQAQHYLLVYRDHSQIPLYLARAKRFATPGQRIVLHARDRGCTHPGCTTPGYWCQAHHITGWARDHGPSDITNLTLACGPHNRLIETTGWTTTTDPTGRTQWQPPPDHPTRGGRASTAGVNLLHHPEQLLRRHTRYGGDGRPAGHRRERLGDGGDPGHAREAGSDP